jgi:hypothetical protein
MNPGPLIKSKPATRAQNRPVPGTASKRIARPCGVRWLGARAVLDARAAFERLVKRSIEAAREQRPAPTLFAPETPHRPQLKLAPQARLRGPKSMRKPSPPKRLSDQPNPEKAVSFVTAKGDQGIMIALAGTTTIARFTTLFRLARQRSRNGSRGPSKIIGTGAIARFSICGWPAIRKKRLPRHAGVRVKQ